MQSKKSLNKEKLICSSEVVLTYMPRGMMCDLWANVRAVLGRLGHYTPPWLFSTSK